MGEMTVFLDGASVGSCKCSSSNFFDAYEDRSALGIASIARVYAWEAEKWRVRGEIVNGEA